MKDLLDGKQTRIRKILLWISLLFNLAIFIQEVWYFQISFRTLKSELIWFTFDSNMYMGLVAFVTLIDIILALFTRRETAHRWVLILKYTGTCAVMITFLTVVCYLIPVVKAKDMFKGAGLFAHLLVPLEAFFSFVFMERGARLKFRHAFLGIIPVLIYGIVYVSLIQMGRWSDHYCLMLTDPWYFSIMIVAAVFFLIVIAVAALYALWEKKVIHFKY